MIKILVWPEIAMKETTIDFKDNLVISITSPGREHVAIKGTNIHKFQFHDVTEEYFLENQNRIVRPIEKEIAESIVEVALRNKDCSQWIIHCEAGVSRSPAVAMGLGKYISLEPGVKELEKLFPSYNTYVRELIEETLYLKVQEECIKNLGYLVDSFKISNGQKLVEVLHER